MRIRAVLGMVIALSIGSSGYAQTEAEDVAKVEGMLKASAYDYAHVKNPNAPVWTIALKGTSLGPFTLVVTTQKGMVVTFVTVAVKDDIRRTPELAENLLKLNLNFDYAKVGFDQDEDVFIRIDTLLRTLDVRALNEIIRQVADGANSVHVVLKPYLKKG